MSAFPALGAFPKRPVKLRGYGVLPSTFLGWFLALLAVMAALVLTLGLYLDVASLIDDYRLRSGGVVALHSTVSNYRYRGRHPNPEFDVSFVTQDGITINDHVNLSTSTEPDRNTPFVVRYDPASPRHFTTSWGAQSLSDRTFTSFLFAGFYLLVLVAALRSIPRTLQNRRSRAGVSAHPTPIAASLVKAGAPTKSHAVYISFSWPPLPGHSSNPTRTGIKRFERDEAPFWLDAAKSKMLALQGPDGYAVLLDAALTWVDLSDSERAQIMAAQAHPSPAEPSRTPGPEPAREPFPQPQPILPTQTAPNSPLRNAAIELSVALNEIVSGLNANTSERSAKAKDLGSRLSPYVEEFDKAVFVTRSREEASKILATLIRSRAAENACQQIDPRNESVEPIDLYGVGEAVGRYRQLTTIFREMKYHNDTL